MREAGLRCQEAGSEGIGAKMPTKTMSVPISVAVPARRVVPFYEATHPSDLLPRRRRALPAIHLGFWDGDTYTHAEAQTNMNHVLAKRIALRPGERVLDAGCGLGGSTIWLAQQFGAEVVGVNLVASQLYRARRLAYRHGISDRVSFERRDFTRTGFPEESFDVVWAIESVCHTPDKRSFLAEAKRLLKPGGRLVVADLFRTQHPFSADEEKLLNRWLAGWAVPDLTTTGEFAEAACGVGFTVVTVEDATADVWPSLLRMYRLGLVGYPAASFLKALRLYDDDRLASARSCLQQYHALRRDLWLYGIFTARVEAQ